MYENRTGGEMTVSRANPPVLDLVITQLAFVRGLSEPQLRADIAAAGGDLEIDSKVGQAVAALVEVALDMEGAIKPEDQNRNNLTTVRSLERLIRSRQPSAEGKGQDG